MNWLSSSHMYLEMIKGHLEVMFIYICKLMHAVAP